MGEDLQFNGIGLPHGADQGNGAIRIHGVDAGDPLFEFRGLLRFRHHFKEDAHDDAAARRVGDERFNAELAVPFQRCRAVHALRRSEQLTLLRRGVIARQVAAFRIVAPERSIADDEFPIQRRDAADGIRGQSLRRGDEGGPCRPVQRKGQDSKLAARI